MTFPRESPDVTEQLARAALCEFGLPHDAELEFVKYRENHVFRVRSGGDSWALKLHRPGYRTDQEIESEAAVLVSLHGGGIRVTEPLRTLDGSHVARVPRPGATGGFQQASVQRWIADTRPLGDSTRTFDGLERPDDAQLYELGRMMGRLHAHTESNGAPDRYQRPPWDASGLVGDRALWGRASDLPNLTAEQRSLLLDVEHRLADDLSALPRSARHYGPIHADSTLENVLVDDHGLVLIDFDDSGEGWYLFDLATVYFFCSHHPESADILDSLIAGYRNARALPASDLSAWHPLLLARALSYLGWSVERPGDPASVYHETVLLPWILDAAEEYVRSGSTGWDVPSSTSPTAPSLPSAPEKDTMERPLLDRRYATLGPYSPLFYEQPIHFVTAAGVWLTDVNGDRYLDAYNNVPHVGHAHPHVVEAIRAQASALNIHTRYLNERVVEYAENLLATFDPGLDRVMFTNSGSESNDLAFRIAGQHSGHSGILISDFSYHGHTRALAEATTGLDAVEALGAHVRAIRIPDLDGADRGRIEADVLTRSLREIDEAIASLQEHGYGVAAALIDSLFSTEGLNRLPTGYVAGLAERVRRAGGLVIGDEVQSGFGRTGSAFWGHELHGIVPDLVTMGKPMGNGHPVGGVVLPAALLDEFGPRNMYFNTFGGNPVSAAAGQAVLDVLEGEQLVTRAQATSQRVRQGLEELRATHDFIGPVKGAGLFFGFEVFDGPADDPTSRPDAARTKEIVESMRRAHVLISKIGRNDTVLKMRPPLAIQNEEADILLDRLATALGSASGFYDRGHDPRTDAVPVADRRG